MFAVVRNQLKKMVGTTLHLMALKPSSWTDNGVDELVGPTVNNFAVGLRFKHPCFLIFPNMSVYVCMFPGPFATYSHLFHLIS